VSSFTFSSPLFFCLCNVVYVCVCVICAVVLRLIFFQLWTAASFCIPGRLHADSYRRSGVRCFISTITSLQSVEHADEESAPGGDGLLVIGLLGKDQLDMGLEEGRGMRANAELETLRLYSRFALWAMLVWHRALMTKPFAPGT